MNDWMHYVDIYSTIAVYVQIENHIQFAIASGRLKPGDRVPVVREAAKRLGVNPNTVTKAYRDLQVMGLLSTRRGMGAFVTKGAESRCVEKCRKEVVGRLFEGASEAKAAGIPLTELRKFVQKAYASDTGPYGPVPKELLDLATKKGSQ